MLTPYPRTFHLCSLPRHAWHALLSAAGSFAQAGVSCSVERPWCAPVHTSISGRNRGAVEALMAGNMEKLREAVSPNISLEDGGRREDASQ